MVLLKKARLFDTIRITGPWRWRKSCLGLQCWPTSDPLKRGSPQIQEILVKILHPLWRLRFLLTAGAPRTFVDSSRNSVSCLWPPPVFRESSSCSFPPGADEKRYHGVSHIARVSWQAPGHPLSLQGPSSHSAEPVPVPVPKASNNKSHTYIFFNFHNLGFHSLDQYCSVLLMSSWLSIYPCQQWAIGQEIKPTEKDRISSIGTHGIMGKIDILEKLIIEWYNKCDIWPLYFCLSSVQSSSTI